MSSTAFSIRHARLEDTAALTSLSAQLGYPVVEGDLHRRLRSLLDKPTQAVFVACDEDDQVKGYICAEQRTSLVAGAHVEITALCVDGSARRQGAGRALVLAAELWAHKRGVTEIRVRSNIQREEAHAFYPGIDYHLEKTQHCYHRKLG